MLLQLLQSDIFQFLVLLASIAIGTASIVWKIAAISNEIIHTQKENTTRIEKLEQFREVDANRISKLEWRRAN